MAQRYFATTLPGLEIALLQELRVLRCKRLQEQPGGVEFEATRRGLYQVLHHTRCAHRVLQRLDTFRLGDVADLHRKAQRIDWSRLLPPDAHIKLHITTHQARIESDTLLKRTLLDAITKAASPEQTLQRKEDEATGDGPPPFGLWVRVEGTQCTLSYDTAGEMLYPRGWRTKTGKAPLRESIASALLYLVGWTPGVPLWDPMCGAGTFLIEAARIARSLPPRLNKRYQIHRQPGFDAALWQEVVKAPLLLPPTWTTPTNAPSSTTDDTPLFRGCDQDAAALKAARENAQHAEVAQDIVWNQQPIEQLQPDNQPPGFLITNPPYGKRLPRKKQREPGAERLLLSRFASDFSGWTLGLLLPRGMAPKHPDLHAEALAHFRNGGLPVSFWRLRHNTH